EVGCDGQRSPTDQQPPRLVVAVGVHPVETGIAERRDPAAQVHELAIPVEQGAVGLFGEFGPLELGALEGGGILGIGEVVGIPAESRELTAATPPTRPPQTAIAVAGEVP